MNAKISLYILAIAIFSSLTSSFILANSETLVFEAKKEGIGKDKHIVLLTGDHEYRSEETNPMLAKILNTHFGFKTTVLFAINPKTGFIDPNYTSNVPGMEALKTADLVIMNFRFRRLPKDQLQHLEDYIQKGKPIIGLRTSTHAFRNHFNPKERTKVIKNWDDFGLKYLGEKWVSHHGKHKVEGCRGVIVEKNKNHPILRSVTDIFALSDVYTVSNLDRSKATILVNGAVTKSLKENSKILDGPKNNPTQPAIWIYEYTSPNGTKGKSICSTMGSSVDFKSEGLRRVIVNSAIFLVDLEVPKKSNVNFVDSFNPTMFGVNDPSLYKKLKLTPSSYSYRKSPETGILPIIKHWFKKKKTKKSTPIK